jgi:protocatechuate 3,4-dioxygenase beta subunit
MAQQERDKMLTLMLAALLAFPQGANEGVIEVTVRDLETRQGIQAVRVTLTLVPTQSNQPRSLTLSSVTDDKGIAEFKNLVYGVYNVRAEREGYGAGQLDNPTTPSVFIRDDAPRLKTELNLIRSMTLSGRILTPDGAPFVDAHVAALSVGYKDGQRALSRVTPRLSSFLRYGGYAEAYTNERGEYRIAGLPPGDYYVRVDNGGFNKRSDDRDAMVSYYPGVLRTPEAVSITLRDRDESGRDVRIPRTPLFKISGTLVGLLPDRPLPNRSFFLGSAAPDNIDEPERLAIPNVETGAPGEARFEIRGVVPGIYHLYAETGANPFRLVRRTLVQIVDRDLIGLRIGFGPLPEVKGKILIEGDASAIPWSSMNVAVTPKELLPLLLGGSGVASNAGRLGSNSQAPHEFTLAGLIEDVRYAPVLFGLPPDAYVADIRQGGSSVFNNGDAIRSNDGPIEIAVGLRGGVLQGVVRDASGQAVAQAGVVLVPSAPRRQTTQLYKEVPTNASGQFTFRGVAPGEYKVFAWPAIPRGRAYTNEEFISRYEFRGANVTVRAGATATVQVPVTPLQ